MKSSYNCKAWNKISIAVVLFSCLHATAQLPRPVSHSLESTVYDTVRNITVVLPKDYYTRPERRFEVLYVLDAQDERLFDLAASIVNYATGDNFIPVILVGIRTTSRWDEFLPAPEHQETVDLVSEYFGEGFKFGHADNLAAHLKSELFPFVEKLYRTLPTRLAIGHSLGGTFLTYCNVRYPELFNGTVCISPNLVFDNSSLLDKVARFKNSEPALQAYNFIAYGSADSYERQFLPGITSAIKLFESPDRNSTLFGHKQFTDANHATVLSYGIQAGLSDFYNKVFLTGNNVIAYYDAMMTSCSINVTPDDVDALAQKCLSHEKSYDALTIIKWGLRIFPDNSDLYLCLGEVQESLGNSADAAECYRSAAKVLQSQKTLYNESVYARKLIQYNSKLRKLRLK